MRRFFIFFIGLLICTLCYAQQNRIIGLYLGEKYSEEDVLPAINRWSKVEYELSSRTNHDEEVLDEDMEQYRALIRPVALSLRFSPTARESKEPVYEIGLMKDGALANVGVSYLMVSKEEADNIFASWNEELSKTYKVTNREPAKIDFTSDEGIIITLKKEDDFVYALFIHPVMASNAVEVLFPPVQDTFFGLTLGNPYTPNEVKKALSTKGNYSNSERTPDGGWMISFMETAFGGHLWDYCNIHLSSNGLFLQFHVYDSEDSGYYGKSAAAKVYYDYKESLNNKYSQKLQEKKFGEDLRSTYIGGNRLLVEVYLKKEKSKGDTFRWFTGIYYVDYFGLEKIQEDNQNEL